jgi:hypothetical protein
MQVDRIQLGFDAEALTYISLGIFNAHILIIELKQNENYKYIYEWVIKYAYY